MMAEHLRRGLYTNISDTTKKDAGTSANSSVGIGLLLVEMLRENHQIHEHETSNKCNIYEGEVVLMASFYNPSSSLFLAS